MFTPHRRSSLAHSAKSISRTTAKLVVASLTSACLLLTACGGGGDNASEPPLTPPPAINQGVYAGSTSNTAASSFQLLVLEDGSAWATYGTQSASAFLVQGFVQGQAGFNNGKVTSGNIRDYGFSPAVAGKLTGNYDGTPAVSGQISYASGNVSFSSSAIASSTYNYQAAAQLSDVSGNWSVSLTTGETASLTISNSGVIGGVSSSGCNFTGQIAPRASGKNVFNVRLTFTSAQCALQGQTATGVGLTYPTASSQRQLIVLVQDASRLAGVAAFGTR